MFPSSSKSTPPTLGTASTLSADGSRQKKRALENDPENVTGSSGLLSPGESSRQFPVVKRGHYSLETPFQKEMKEIRDNEFFHLNLKMQKIVDQIKLQLPSNPPRHPDDPVLSLVEKEAAAYRYCASEIARRFGGNPAGSIATFGMNDTHQLGFDNEGKDCFPLSLVPTLTGKRMGRRFRAVACGGMHSVGLAEDGIPWTWGSNDFGNLGRPTKDDKEEMIAACVTGFVTTSGANEDGTITQVSAGESHTLFLSLGGNIYSTGMYKEKDKVPFRVTANLNEEPKGTNRKPQHMWQIPAGKAIMVFSGGDFAAAILEDRSMVAWGFGVAGELGRSADMTSPNAKGEYDLGPAFYMPNGEFDMNLIKEHFMTPKPPRFNWGSPRKEVLTVGCGLYHMLVVAREPGEPETHVYSCGHNGFGQLGHGDDKSRHELTLIRKLEGENIAQVDGGEHFSMALCMQGKRLFTFGRSDKGMLGRGPPEKDATNNFVLEPVPKLVTFPEEEPVLIAKISAGDRHAIAITAENEIYTWGFEGSTGHLVDEDICWPTKIEVKHLNLQKKPGSTKTDQAVDASGGGQHSAVIIASLN